jgi:regulator of sigma E protease
MNIFLPVFLFGILVFIHEGGHFLVAKWSGVFVERFALGFGPAILKKRWGETEYAICLFPLGGYVKMRGEDPDGSGGDAPVDPRSFASQSVWKRFAIVVMGPVSNLILPVLLFTGLFLAGTPVPTSRIGSVVPDYPAAKAGLRAGDEIVRVDGKDVRTWNEVMGALKSRAGLPTALTVRRAGESLDRSVTPVTESEPDMYGEIREVGKIGIDLQPYRAVIGIPDPSSKGARAGLKTGDRVEGVNGSPVTHFWELEEAFRNHPRRKSLTVRRGTGETPGGPPSTHTIDALSLQDAGIEEGELYIREVQPGSIAEEAGLRPGDKLLSINREPLRSWHAFRKRVQENRGEALVVEVLRNRKPRTIELIPREVDQKDEVTRESRKVRQLGVISSALPGDPDVRIERHLNPLSALARGVEETVEISKTTLIGLGKLVSGRLGLHSIGGPIAIFHLAGSSYRMGGWSSYFRIMAILSITLAVLNLLPIPVLDGGHLFFFLIEAVKGSPVRERVRNAAQQVGLAIIIGLMVLTFYVDIHRYLLGPIRALFN